MFDINYKNNKLKILNIKENELEQLLRWYNDTEDYMFGTGIDRKITLKELKDRFLETEMSSHEFFSWVINSQNEKVGIIKGSVKYQEKDSLWINSLLINPEKRRLGYGRDTIRLLIKYIKEYFDLSKVYVSVIEDNKSGIAFWENIGFKEVKILKKHTILQGKAIDVIIMCKAL